MLKIDNISYSIQGRPIFEGASATIPTGHKVGLIGRNGAGKTTLFKLITGELALDGGAITLPSRSRIGGVAQEAEASAVSLLDTVLAADKVRLALLKESEETTDPNRIGEIYVRLSDIDAWTAEARAATILNGLGFTHEEQAMPCSDFSGGWRMRVALAAVLFSEPELLLLDEPTNYLDLEGALWLENYLSSYPHTIMIVSHDRELLNRSVGSILHLEDRKLTYYTGTYDQFARQRAEQRAVQAAAAKKQELERAHLQSFVDRFKAKASKAKQAQSRVKMLEKMTPISSPEEAAKQVFTFPEPEELSPPIITIHNASVGYNRQAVLRGLDLRIDQDDRIALLGKNGQGKSTLSKLLAGKLDALSGDVTTSRKLRVGYFAQHQVEELFPDETPLQHLITARPLEHHSKLRARLAGFGLGADQATTEVKRLSGGQKARLSLLLATLDAPHLLILDEPTNHLDIESREALVEALTRYTGAVILVSHDMHLLSLVADRLWLVNDGRVAAYEEDLQAYRKLLLSGGSRATQTEIAKKPKKDDPPPKVNKAALEAKVEKAWEQLEGLEAIKAQIEAKLADPELYTADKQSELTRWQDKLKRAEEGIVKAEKNWEEAQARLS